MARMPNAEIGFLPCFCCGTRSSLRKNSSGALYFICPLCGGPIYGNGQTWQDRCLDDATMHGEAGPPIARKPIQSEKPPAIVPSAATMAPVPAPTPKKEKPPGDKPSWGFIT